MTTVVQVVQHLRPGGIETMSLDLTSFGSHGDNTLIISLEGCRESAINAWPRLAPYADRLIFLGKKPGVKPGLILELNKLFRKLKTDIVHTHHIGPLLYAGLAARLAGVKKLIHTEHDAWHLDDQRRRSLQRNVIRLAHPLLIADAEAVASNMKKHLGKKEIKVIRNGIDSDYFRPGDKYIARQRLDLPPRVRLVGCSGRLELVKGQHILIDALSRLPEDVHIALAGSGSEEANLRRQAAALMLDKRVHFLGRIDQMPTFYQALDLFCQPSLNEGLPLSPLEAQACGIPAVVTNVGGSCEALCPESGELIPRDDEEAMADAIYRMLLGPPKGSPRAFVKQHGDVRLMAEAYAALRSTGNADAR